MVSLPIKLTVSFMIIAMMVPPMMGLIENIQEDIEVKQITSVAEDLATTVDMVGTKGPGYMSHEDIVIPSNCHLEIGGEESMVIRAFLDDEQVGRALLDYPVTGPDMDLFGDVILEISRTDSGVEVREI